ncbi:acetylxylan esterase [Streptomyces sp. TG1A-8]|uniref:acetylxylan esterase n=1 Tax=Streptomyces sp. TG1A-8 TaxID=3051385 RepID=UPI00265C0BEC|nr:acetylxylan esterase [Streptomyces sp. TG1A-8]MDO0924166.1 acetylxylan esterase [Streptomyces sp. TG1A-8]
MPYVDDRRIGVLGVCAGGGYAVNAAMTEHRIKAVGAVVPVDIGRARRSGGSVIEDLEAVGERRTTGARGGEPLITHWIPDSPQDVAEAGITDIDMIEAVDYHQTPWGRRERSVNRLQCRSVASVIAFDAFHLVDELLTPTSPTPPPGPSRSGPGRSPAAPARPCLPDLAEPGPVTTVGPRHGCQRASPAPGAVDAH